MITKISSDSPISPVATVDEAIVHMRLVEADEAEREFIAGLVEAATDYIEGATNQTFCVRVRRFEVVNEGKHEGLFNLPIYSGSLDVDAPALVRVADDGTQTAVDLNTEALRRGYMAMNDLGECGDHSILTVTMGRDKIEPLARAAILMCTAHWYEHREAVDDGRSLGEVPMSVKSIIALLRRHVYA